MLDRNSFFQTLKPPCVELSQAALLLSGQQGDIPQVTRCLENIKRILTDHPDHIDEKLADYVFFPLSHVLKSSQKVSIRCLELCLECIAILAAHGWQKEIEPRLAAQLVILCTLLADRQPKNFSFSESTDELQVAAFASLRGIFSAAGASHRAKDVLTSESNFPQLGQTISNILDGVENGHSSAVQVAATQALESLIHHLADQALSASFLPGIASRVTRVLTPSTKQRRSPQVLVTNLRLLATLIERTLSDRSTEALESFVGSAKVVQTSTAGVINSQWIANASDQLKTALTSIVRLRGHSRDDVKEALCGLCTTVLRRCNKNLSNCAQLALETVIALSVDSEHLTKTVSLEADLRSNQGLSALLQDVTYGWLQSLPTVMQSADEDSKLERIRHITSAYVMLSNSNDAHPTLDKAILASLREALALTLQTQPSKTDYPEPQIRSLDLMIPQMSDYSGKYRTALVENRNQKNVLDSIESLVCRVDQSGSSSDLVNDLARSLRLSHGEAQLSSFWLLLTITQDHFEQRRGMSDFIVDSETRPGFEGHLEDLYSFAVSVLADDDEQYSDRLRMLALRTVALRARSAGEEFRFELLDALYPVLHTLATPSEFLQGDSIVTLNVIAEACSYSSVKELIVENADYLTNAVALKLNSFDVSPQGPQVLLMMVRLAGPSLLPHLEDTVESIFAALEDFHGYPMLVQLLFQVLRVVAEEGVKAPALAITDKSSEVKALLSETWRPTDLDKVRGLIMERRAEAMIEPESLEPHPKRPWRQHDHETLDIEDADSDAEEAAELETGTNSEEPSPPIPKTYNLLLKITELTQHFLPSASSTTTTTTLLGLIQTTVPAISQHENSFLPLINTLWPEITARLDDEGTPVQSQSLEIIATVCQHAGTFMQSRIVQLWPRLIELYESIAQDITVSARLRPNTASKKPHQTSTASIARDPVFRQAVARMQGSIVEYSDTTARTMWNALIKVLGTVADKVQLPPDLFDQALELLTPVLDDGRIRGVLEKENADAVWLARVRSGSSSIPEPPTVPEGKGWVFAPVSVR